MHRQVWQSKGETRRRGRVRAARGRNGHALGGLDTTAAVSYAEGMLTVVILGVICVFVAGAWIAVSQSRKARRRRLLMSPFPDSLRDILLRNLPPYRHLPESMQEKLHGLINLFLGEKRFEGCGGQEITDEVRVTIAAQACLLLVGRGTNCYPRLRTVLVYPHTYVAGGQGTFGMQDEPPSARLGESWQSGAVVLSWNSVKGGAANFDDGHNVTLHEFAHQLDQEDGSADGTPILGSLSCYRSWATALTDEYRSLMRKVKGHRNTVIDEYGATNPAEFFATASEAFFEKPDQLASKRPALYEELQHYYALDPRSWN